MNKFISLFNYVKNFDKEFFQGKISYHYIEKNVILSVLFNYLQIYLFLKNKENKNFIDVNRYIEEFHNTFDEIEFSEQSIVNLYLDIQEQSKYIRNVQIACFIVYKENWKIFNLEKAIKNKTYLNKIIK